MAVVAPRATRTVTATTGWEARPRAALLTRLLVAALPVVVAITAAVLVGRAVAKPSGAGPVLLWFGLLFAVAGGVLMLVERAARRLLPIAALLELTLVFPDRTPSRFAVALRAGMMGRPDRRLHRLVDAPQEEPVESVLALVLSLGAHDRRTQGHSERVRAYAEVIADELRLGADERNRLRWSALLHDIGKLAVHPHVLQKKGTLDDAEWEQIRRHPEEGARLVATLVPWLGEWAAVVAQHHERWDGTGYPAGLSGPEISLGGRIVAVADAFEVMTAGRTYAGAIASPAARTELLECAGSQFDPTIVRAFLNAGIARAGWISRGAAWIGAAAFAGRSPGRDLATRSTVAVAAGVVAAVLAAPLPAAVPPSEAAAEVAGVRLEREASEAPVAAPPVAAPSVEVALPVEPPPVEAAAPVDGPAAVPVATVVTPAPVVAVVPVPVPAPAEIVPELAPPLLLERPAPLPPVPPELPPPPPPAPAPPAPPAPSGFARDDAVSTTGRPLRIAPLDNDGLDGVTLDLASLEVVDGADHGNGQPGGERGTLKDGVIAYKPKPSFTGVDSITYRVCTTTGVCETATVLITVTDR